jgi:dolichol-phosphate mannosyltransferase
VRRLFSARAFSDAGDRLDLGDLRGRGHGAVAETRGVMTVLVVLPTYNERPNLERVAALVLQHAFTRLLVVDDASPDGTGEIADALAARSGGRVDVLHRTGARGLGRAYIDGLTRALATGADAICQMDADLSHDPKYLPDLLTSLETHDLVIGSRYLHGVSVVNWPLQRIMLSAFANRYIRMVTGLAVRDCTSGFRLWRRDALAQVPFQRARTGGYAFLTEMLYEAARVQCRIAEVPIIFIERREGTSKVSSSVLIESLMTPWRLVLRGGRVPPVTG